MRCMFFDHFLKYAVHLPFLHYKRLPLNDRFIFYFFLKHLDLGAYSNVRMNLGGTYMKIKQFAEKFQLTTDTVRYYEKRDSYSRKNKTMATVCMMPCVNIQ